MFWRNKNKERNFSTNKPIWLKTNRVMNIIKLILLWTGIVAWSCVLFYLIYIIYCVFLYCWSETMGKCISNLLTAYKWYKMPIEQLNIMWMKNSRHGYCRIRHCKRFVWVCRYILVKRVRKYRKQLIQ